MAPRDLASAATPVAVAAARSSSELAGVGLFLISLLVFGIVDGMAKELAEVGHHGVQIAWARFAFGAMVILPIVLARGAGQVFTTRNPVAQVGRAVFLLCSTTLFVLGLAELPMAESAAITFVAPMILTALSIPLLGEQVGVRRWAAIVVGFIGALIIIRPGFDAFQPAAIFPLLSAVSWAIGMVITRRMRAADPTLTTLSYTVLIGCVLISAIVWRFWTWPDVTGWVLMVAMGVLTALAQYLVVRAFQLAFASTLAPFSYGQMPWVTLLGWLLFGALPDLWTWIGAAVIIASGIYIWHRELVRMRAATVPIPGAGPSDG